MLVEQSSRLTNYPRTSIRVLHARKSNRVGHNDRERGVFLESSVFHTVRPSAGNELDNEDLAKGTSLNVREPTIRVLRSTAELEHLREDWCSWPSHRESEMDRYLFFLQSNPRSVRPHVIAVYREGGPDAILVGRIDRGSLPLRLGYISIKPQALMMVFVYGALLGNPSRENCELIVGEVLRSLSQGEADVAYMNYLREESELYRICIKKPSSLCRDFVRAKQPHFAIKLPDSVEEFYKGISANTRWQAKSKQKKLVKDYAGDVKIRSFHKVSEVDSLVEGVEEVAKSSYQRGIGVGFVDSPELRDTLRFKAERGWLRGYILYLGGCPSAFWVGDINKGTFGSDFLGYKSELGKHSPGMYLTLKVIEEFCQNPDEGVREVDFAMGYAQYKEVLANQGWRETCVHIFAPTLKGISLNMIKTSISGLDQSLKNVLARTSVLQKIKKMWRDYATRKVLRKS